MTNQRKQKLLLKTLKRIKWEFPKYSLSRYKEMIVDAWDTKYMVDFDIQRHPYFKNKECIQYLEAFFNGASTLPITVVDINKTWNNVNDGGQRAKATWWYFKRYYDAGYNWLSVDGNNRNWAWYRFFNDMFKLPKGFQIPLWNLQTDSQYLSDPFTKPMSYSDILNDDVMGDEFKQYMIRGDEKIRIDTITQCTKPQLHNIFRCINQGQKLKQQEDRNCIDVEIAEWVRRHANDDDKFGKFLLNEFNETNINYRDHESFVAFTLTMIHDFGNMFPTGFGEKPIKTISEKIVTSHYEDDTLVDKDMVSTKKALTKLKGYAEWTNSGTQWVGTHLQLSRALIMLFHKIDKDYYVDDWNSVYEWVGNFHTEQVTNNDKFKFPHISDERTYNDIIKSGVKYLSVIYQIFASQLILLETNEIIRVKQARVQATSDIRETLYKDQKGFCKITGNTITEWNNTSLYHVDHIIPISKWLSELHGTNPNAITNLQLVEKTANLKKSNKIEPVVPAVVTQQHNSMGM
jgi:hypothetical protein